MPGGSWEGAIGVPDVFREGARWFLGGYHRGARCFQGGCQVVPGRVPLECQGVLEGAIGVPSGSWEGAKCLLGGCQVIPKRVL